MLFSQRQGITKAKKAIQKDSMDDDLRRGLWDSFYILYLKVGNLDFAKVKIDLDILFKRLWVSIFKQTVDNFPYTHSNYIYNRDEIIKKIKNHFFNCEWFEVYDFLEFVVKNHPDKTKNQKFNKWCNTTLRKESSAYNFVGDKIATINSETEISEIDEALESTDNLKPVNDHLKKALDFLADRQSPDYNNSIKESISAVESICSLIAGIKKAKLGDALKKIKKEGKVKIHPALEIAFDTLYGYTSDEGGVRHAKIKESDVDNEEAKFMLVSCSAFINYFILKLEKAGIKL